MCMWHMLRMRPTRRLSLTGPVRVVTAAVTVAVVLAASTTAGAGSLRIPRGSTLDGIAAQLGVTTQELATANHLADPNLILAGSDLVVPDDAPARSAADAATASSTSGSAGTVEVLPGQTLWSLAVRWGTSVDVLAALNSIADPNLIYAGADLRLPGAGPTGVTASDSAGTAALGSEPDTTEAGSFPERLLAAPDRLTLVPVFQTWAAHFGVPSRLLEAMCWWESGWQASVLSSTGAIGIGQLEPATVARVRGQLGEAGLDPWVAEQNIEMSAAFFGELLAQAGGNEALALAYYYQGAKSVARVGVLPFTQLYVSGILDTAAAYSW
jgi:LysM repeat protein